MVEKSDGIWQLQVFTRSSTNFVIFGNEAVFNIFIQEWKVAIEQDAIKDSDSIILTVEGFCDTLDGAPATLVILACDVLGAFKSRIYK